MAARSLPMPLVMAMVFATWFGAETVLGISATFLDEGFRGLISDPLGASVCLILFGLVFALPLYRLKLMTLGDFFHIRYNKKTEMILSTCIVLSYLGWVSAQVTALGLVFNVLSEGTVTMTQGMMIGAAVVLAYTLFGGMWSVAVTTFVQMIIIVIGLLLVTNEAGTMAGGIGVVIEQAAAEGKFEWLPSLDLLDMLGWMAALFTMALGSIPQQDVFQRVNTSKSEFVAVWATTLGGVAYFFFAAVPLFLAYTPRHAVATNRLFFFFADFFNYNFPNRQVIFFRKRKIPLVVARYGHDRARAIGHQNVISHPNWYGLIISRINGLNAF